MDVQEKLNDAMDFVGSVDEGDDPYDLIIARESADRDDDTTSYEFGRAKMVGDLPEHLGRFALDWIKNKKEEVDDGTKEGTGYSAANISDQKDYVQHVAPDHIPRFSQYDELLTTHDFSPTNYITDNGVPPNFQVILVRDGTDSRLLAFQDITRREILGKDDKIRFYSSDEHYMEVNETILEVPNRIDAIYYDDSLLVFDQRRFERIFDYLDEFHEAAESTVETIVESEVPIHTHEMFLDAATSYPNATRILYAVRERALWEHENVSMDVFEYIINEFDLAIGVEERDGQRGIVMDNKRHVWEVIHLYNDDHLSSPISEIGYQVHGKDARTDDDADN